MDCKYVLLLAVALMLGAACTPADEAPQVRPTSTPFEPFAEVSKGELEGTTWLLESYGPEEERRAVLEDSEAYIEFNNYEDMSGFAGCNYFGTRFDIEAERLITDGIDRTRFDCPDEALREQDEAILASLGVVESIGLEGDLLMLGSENAVLRFSKEPPPPVTPLSGSFWQFDGFMVGDDFRPVLYGSVITAEMAEGVIRGTSGCNAYGSDYEVDGERFSAGETVQTAMLCLDGELMEQEDAYISALGAATAYTFDEHTLSIDYGGGRLLFSRPRLEESPFEGTLWHLVDLAAGGETAPMPGYSGITAQFDGREISGWTGCNQYLGAYMTSGPTVSLGSVDATEEGCPDQASSEHQRRFLRAIRQGPFNARVTEDELTLANVDATMVFSSEEPFPSGGSGIPGVDEAVGAILSNDLSARRELIRFTTAGCTTVMGLGGPPKCDEGQAEGTPVEYFPVLGPGEGAPIAPEAIEDTLDVQFKRLYAAFRRNEDLYADPFYPPGSYGLIFEAGRGESVPCFVVRLDEDGRIVRLDYLMFSALDLIEQEATEVLVPAEGERCERVGG